MKIRTTVYISEGLHALARLERVNLSTTLEQALEDRLGGTRDQLEERALVAVQEAEALKGMALLSNVGSARLQAMGLDFLKLRAKMEVPDKAHVMWVDGVKHKYGFGKKANSEELYNGIKAFLATSPDADKWRHDQKEKARRMAELQKRLEKIQKARKGLRNNGSG